MSFFVYSEEHEIPTVEAVIDDSIGGLSSIGELAEVYPACIYFEVEHVEHVILVAFQVTAASRAAAEKHLVHALPRPKGFGHGNDFLECWWVAEDDRHDGSDNDSAIFVEPGTQHIAAALLHEHGLTGAYNVVEREVRGQFEIPEQAATERWLVEIHYNTEHDGAIVSDDEPTPRTVHGPFLTAEFAEEWASARTDGDTDVSDVLIIPLNTNTQEG